MKLAWFNPALVVALSAAAGLVPVYTDLKRPDFGAVAKAMGPRGTASRRQATSRSPFGPGSRNTVPRCCVWR